MRYGDRIQELPTGFFLVVHRGAFAVGAGFAWLAFRLRRDLVILACAISAGIHGALAPQHFAGATAAGVGFVAATVALAALAIAVTLRPTSAVALVGAPAVFAGLLGSYALAITTGVPVLHPDREPLDGLALATKAIEAAGLLAAWSLVRRPSFALVTPHPKGTA